MQLLCARRLHLLLARDAALRKCTGEGTNASAFQEEAAMAAALKRAFLEMDEEILAESRRDGLRDGSTAVVIIRLGMVQALLCMPALPLLCRDIGKYYHFWLSIGASALQHM